MLVDLKRMVSYICPFCSNISSKSITVFNLSGKPKLQLVCPTHGCHETCVTITPKGGKYKIDIECPLCGGMHSYSTAQETFWNKKLLTYKCPAAGIDVFFAGERREVERVLEESSDMYSDIIDEMYDDVFYNSDLPFDIIDGILEVLRAMNQSNKLSCVCGSSNISVDMKNGSIVLTCRRCGRTKKMNATGDTLSKLINSRTVVIGK